MTSEPKPHHLAIIMDGNRRWATARGLPKFVGHTEGGKNLRTIARAVHAAGIPYLTLYTLSTENLRERSQAELEHLFALFEKLIEYVGDFSENNTRLRLIGDISALPAATRQKLQEVVERTKNNSALVLTLAINYGGRDEIIRAVQKISASGVGAAEIPRATEISEKNFSDYLDTAGLPDVDLVIRTGGHHRLSNFLLWQAAYAELYFTDTMWPAFDEAELDRALAWFAEQQRNRGK